MSPFQLSRICTYGMTINVAGVKQARRVDSYFRPPNWPQYKTLS